MRCLSFPKIFLLAGAVVLPCRAYAAPEQLVACGWGNLSIFEVRPGAAEPLRETWFWKPQDYAGVPDKVDDLYRHIDECKPFDGGRRILISASTDGVGLVDRTTRRFIHFGTVHNAHSAELLPGGRIAVAGSHGDDSLTVLDGKPDGQVLMRKPLPGGHGVHWDVAGGRLYALSETAIEVFALVDWEGEHPDLRRVRTIPLPEREGHDLSRIAGTSRFHVTTAGGAWTFDSATDRIVRHPDFAGEANVKAIATHRASGDVAWLKADPGGWWSYVIRVIHGGRRLTAPINKRYYKVRWIDAAARDWSGPR